MIYIQDTWNESEDEELYECLDEAHEYKYTVINGDDVPELSLDNVECLFCDSNVVASLLKNDIIETYPDCLQRFYHRDIHKITVGELLIIQYPYFVKPVSNNKLFNGSIIVSDMTRNYVLDGISDDTMVYYCKEVKFVNEHRIFVLDHVNYASVDCTDYLISKEEQCIMNPPSCFIDSVLKENIYPYCVI